VSTPRIKFYSNLINNSINIVHRKESFNNLESDTMISTVYISLVGSHHELGEVHEI